MRDGDKRIVRLKEGAPRGRHVVVVDDLVQSGGTLIECQKLLAAQVRAGCACRLLSARVAGRLAAPHPLLLCHGRPGGTTRRMYALLPYHSSHPPTPPSHHTCRAPRM